MRILLLIAILSIFVSGCAMDKKPEKPLKDHTPETSVPENLGDPNAPTEVRALQGARQVKKRMDDQRNEESKVLQESDR